LGVSGPSASAGDPVRKNKVNNPAVRVLIESMLIFLIKV